MRNHQPFCCTAKTESSPVISYHDHENHIALSFLFRKIHKNQFYELPLNSCQAIEKAVAKWKDGSAKGWLGLSGMHGHATYAGHFVDLIWETFAKIASSKQKGVFWRK